MAAQAGPSNLRHTSAYPLASNARPSSSREEVDLSNLIARLSIQDIDELESRQGKNGMQGSHLTDAELALSIFAEDARSLITFNSDRALPMALNEAEPRQPVFHANRAASRPRSVMMGNVQALDPMQPQRPNLGAQLDSAPAQTVGRNGNNNTVSWSEWFVSAVNWFVGSPPTRAAPAMPSTHFTGQNCVICRDPIRGGQIRAPCGHYYDIACVTDLFQSATRDESLFPPRCCRQPILFMTVRQHLTPDLIVLFTEKEKEFATLKRVYCAKPSCSQFLGPQSRSIFGNVMTCPAPGCLTRTCRSCKSKVAFGDPHSKCKVDEMDQQILALGKDAGWARCPGCAQMIELQMGCYHMTCRCKTEFCYLCTARWKTCTCTQWDERRLVAAAEERVDLQYRRPHEPRVVIAQAGPRQPTQGVQPRAMAAPRQGPVIPTQNSRGDIAVRDELNLWRVPGAAVTPRTQTATARSKAATHPRQSTTRPRYRAFVASKYSKFTTFANSSYNACSQTAKPCYKLQYECQRSTRSGSR
ncbi:hypothetical protein PILCRDRAFT_613582 [Piloderma croceum F 1598]|uniref:RBR-type E3 ubiquitin transferase n=1 Tax=Piloderma croceum (strain F 1598) TaxID=765440 RepID=A0A0C3FDB7_PILCF|nr:hypothetical protein PILCRDRAFT_613582 [Piloderma croceum F 1598]